MTSALGATSDETANGKETLNNDTVDLNSDLDKTMKAFVNDKDKEGAIGGYGKQASENMIDMNDKGYSDKSEDVDDKGKEGSVLCKDYDGDKDVESNMNAAKAVVKKSADVNDKGEEGAIVGDYKYDGGEEVEMSADNPNTDEIGKADKITKQKNEEMCYDRTAFCYMNDTYESDDIRDSKILYKLRNARTSEGFNELDKEVMEIVLEFCRHRQEFCNSEARGPFKVLLSEEERERYGIPEGAIPTIERPWPAMDPTGQIPKPKRFYADSSFYIFSFWLYLCLRFLRKRLEEVLREIDNKPNDAEV